MSLVVAIFLAATVHSAHAAASGSAPPLEAQCESHRQARFEVLREATSFAVSTRVQEQLAKEVIALRCLSSEPYAQTILRELVDTATLAGQMYALAGLVALQHPDANDLLSRYKGNTTKVRNFGGGVSSYSTVEDIAKGIERGYYLRELLPKYAPPAPVGGVYIDD